MPDNQNSSEWVPRSALRALYVAYVRLLESGRDRIRDLGGSCDPVDVMEAGDIDLRAARQALETPAPAMLNGVEYDRELIARMLDELEPIVGLQHIRESVAEQARLLRAAGNRDAAGVACQLCGGTKGHWEGCRAPIDTPTAAPAGEAVAWLYRASPRDRWQSADCESDAIAAAYLYGSTGEWTPAYTHPPAAEVREVDRVRELLAYIAKYAPEWKGEDGMVVALALHDRIERALSPPGRA